MVTDDEIDRVFRLVIGVNMRWADLQIARLLGDTPAKLGSYIWNHWMGEPPEPTERQVQTAVLFVLCHPWQSDDRAIAGALEAISKR